MIILTENLKDIPSRGFVDIKCEQCGNTYQLTKKTVRENKNYEKRGYCSKRCRDIANGKLILCKCSNCGIDIEKQKNDYDRSAFHFCNSSCAAIYSNKNRESIWNPERRDKMSKWAKNYAHPLKREYLYKDGILPSLEDLTRNCKCGKTFVVKYLSSTKKYCSPTCVKNHAKMGGFRENSSKLHRCLYNGIKMDSGSEKKFAEILDKHNIKWVKNSTKFYPYFYKGKNKKYYPDFYLPDLKIWIEIKGKIYVEPWLPNKLQSVKDTGEEIVIIFSKEIKEDYIINLLAHTTSAALALSLP